MPKVNICKMLSTLSMTLATIFMAIFAYQQMDLNRTEKRIEYAQNKNTLFLSTWDIIISLSHPSPEGINYFLLMPSEQKRLTLDKITNILTVQFNNPVLLQNDECYQLWNDALGSARQLSLIVQYWSSNQPDIDKAIKYHLSQIFDAAVKVSQLLPKLGIKEHKRQGGKQMDNPNLLIGKWVINHPYVYLSSTILAAILIRFISSILKSKASGKRILVHFMDKEESKNYKDHFYPTILGFLELVCYPILMVTSNWSFIGAWLGFKTIAQWKIWNKDRPLFNRFLIGNVLVLIISYLLIVWHLID